MRGDRLVAAILAGCYFGKDRPTRRAFYAMDAILAGVGGGIVIGGAIYDAGCDAPDCQRQVRDLYGGGAGLITLAAFLALATYLFAPPPPIGSRGQPSGGTNAPSVDRPD